jgi:prepilin-type N-terminal cleavage/methylation domain-containing protein
MRTSILLYKRRAFTLAEVLVATAIIAILVGGLFYFLNSNIRIMKHGERMMLLQHEVSNIMSNLYFEIKRINPAVYMDNKIDLWVAGERWKEAKPLEIQLFDMDENLNNKYEKLAFTEYTIDPIWSQRTIEFYLEGSKFYKRIDGKQVVLISEWVDSLHFDYDRTHLDRLDIYAAVKIPGDRQAQELNDSFHLRIKVDNDYVTFVERLKEK